MFQENGLRFYSAVQGKEKEEEEMERTEEKEEEVGESFFSSPATLPSRDEVNHLRDNLLQFSIAKGRRACNLAGKNNKIADLIVFFASM